MYRQYLRGLGTAFFLAILGIFPLPAGAQMTAARNLVTQPVDSHKQVPLHGNVHPLARPQFDMGVAPDDLAMERMLLVLRRGPDQESALRQLLDEQQVKSSAQFHQWLTPQQFGQQFGPADSDLQAVTGWLASEGFQVARVSAGKTVIEFSGSAGLVRQVLGTEIHKFRVNGADYLANVKDPQIPAALAPVVAGFASLNNFPRQTPHRVFNEYSRSKTTGEVKALYTVTSSNNTPLYAVGPTDFATIYNVLPLWNAGIDGAGQTIAVVGQSNISFQDVESFRNIFGLPGNDPSIIYNGPVPGFTEDETEAVLDVEWAGAVAKGATIDLVVSQSTTTTAGIDLSALYIIDNNLAPVMTESYGQCEQFLGAGGNAFYYTIREQGAAQGITIVNSSGDSGSARCDQGGTAVAAQYGLAVSGLASTPFDVAVGGTDFADVNNFSPYWSATNNPSTQASALSYIPETVWNGSCASSGHAGNCSNAANDTPAGIDLLAGGGGPSSCGLWSGTDLNATCVSGYPKPAWQTGTGVPQDGVRDIPDVSLFASTGANNSFYAVCQADAIPGKASCDSFTGQWYFVGVGGTSVAAPNFAGIMAMVNQKTGQRQGNANYVLYPLAAQTGATCTSNPAAVTNPNCIFYDVISGNNSVACEARTENCSNQSGSGFGLLVNPSNGSNAAWTSGAGYDLATGLGSLNAANLVNKWSSVSFAPTTTSIASFPSSITHGQAANFTVTVTSGSGTPAGDFSLIAQIPNAPRSLGSFTLTSGGTLSGSIDSLPGGTYNVVAHYAGDGVHGSSDSAPHPITVTQENSKTTITVSSCSYAGGACTSGVTSAVYGTFYSTVLASVTNAGGQPCASPSGVVSYPCPTGGVDLTVDSGNAPIHGGGGVPLDGQGNAQFPHIDLPAGTYNFRAQYSGDDNYSPNSSATVPVSITKAPTTTTFTGLPATIVHNNFSPFPVRVDTMSRGVSPGCCLKFLANGTLLDAVGNNTAVDGTATNYASLQDSTTPDFPLGPLSVAAVFPGDANYLTSQSAAVNVTVTDFSIAAPASSVNIPASGQTGTAMLTIAPLYGFSGTVNLVVNDGCPLYATCTISPSSVTVSGSTPATATLSIVTYSNAPPRGVAPKPRIPPGLHSPAPWLWILAMLLILGILLGFNRTPQPAKWLLALGAGVVGLWIGCGGGGGGGYTPPPTQPSGTIALSSRNLTFNTQKVTTTSAPESVTVSNTGTGALQIYSVANTGVNPGDYAFTNGCGRSLAVSASCTISLTFTPTQSGSRTTQITIRNDSIEPAASFAVSGTGTVPAVTFTPPSLTFDPQKVGTTSAPQTITLSNSGEATLNLPNITFFSRNFTESNNCPPTLDVGAGCVITFNFAPLDIGTIRDQFAVSDEAGYQTAALSGTGAPPPTPSGSYTVRVRATIGYDSHDVLVPVIVQ